MNVKELRARSTKIMWRISSRTFIYVLLIGLSFVFLYPFLYMLVTSIKSYQDTINPSVMWIPQQLSFSNWTLAFDLMDVERTFFNSLFVTALCTIAHVFVCALVAYGFARFEFRGKNLLFVLVVLSILLPVQMLIVPEYIIYAKLGWIGEYLPMIVPCFFGYGLRGGLFIFLYRQFFLRFPSSLEEAAYIDGCGPIGMFFRIAFPSAGSSVVVTTVLSIVWHWNDFYEPSIYLQKTKTYLLPMMLPSMYGLFEEQHGVLSQAQSSLQQTFHMGVVMAGTAIACLPLLIMFLFMQRKFVEGIERSGLTE